MCVAARACLVVTVAAQTAEEKQASAERLEKLRMEQPKACGVQQIDDLAAKCKTMADATLGVAAVTETLSTGDTDALAEQAADLTKRLQGIGNDLAEATRMMGGAGEALGSIKNPMKIKSATKALNYSKEVIALVTPETAYQGKVVAAMVSGQ